MGREPRYKHDMLDWLRLIRASGLFTIASNLVAAVVVAMYAKGGLDPSWLGARLMRGNGMRTGLVLATSCLLYASGMLWNDLADVERDRVLHPRRPLPSGRVHLITAVIAGVIIAVGALLVAAQLDYGFYAAGIVLSLALLYDLLTKQVPWLGSLTMGAVRFAHACFALLILGSDYLTMGVMGLLGSVGVVPETPGPALPMIYPLILGLYVFGLTLVSELESRRGRRIELIIGGLAMFGAIGAAVFRLVRAHWIVELQQRGQYVALAASIMLGLLLVALLVARVLPPWIAAVRAGRREAIGKIIPSGLGGMILLDAAVATAFQPLAGLAIVMLYPFFRVIGRVIRMD